MAEPSGGRITPYVPREDEVRSILSPGRAWFAPTVPAAPVSDWVSIGTVEGPFSFEYADERDGLWKAIDFTREMTATFDLTPPKTRREKRNRDRVFAIFYGVRNWRAWKARQRHVECEKRRIARRYARRMKP